MEQQSTARLLIVSWSSATKFLLGMGVVSLVRLELFGLENSVMNMTALLF